MQQLVNSNLNLPQLLGHCAKFKPSLNPGTVPIEHLGLVDTDFELSHDIEQGFDYARLLPQLEFRLVKLCFLFLAKLIRVHTKHGNRYSHYLLNRYLYSWDDPLQVVTMDYLLQLISLPNVNHFRVLAHWIARPLLAGTFYIFAILKMLYVTGIYVKRKINSGPIFYFISFIFCVKK